MLSDSETLQSIIDRAGGLSSNALKDGVSIFSSMEILSK